MAQGLLIAAFVLFLIDAIRGKSLTSAGLACWVLSVLLGIRGML